MLVHRASVWLVGRRTWATIGAIALAMCHAAGGPQARAEIALVFGV